MRDLVGAADVSHVMVGVVDLDGTLRAKHLAAEKVLAVIDSGLGFCDVTLGFDSNDAVYENTSMTGWHTGFPDQPVHLAVESCRPLPGDRPSYLLLADYGDRLASICPRRGLCRVVSRATALGFRVSAALEYEMLLLEETPHSVREKQFRDLRPLAPGAFAYSALRSSVSRELYDEIIDTCERLRVPLEGLHPESGAGMIEAGIKAADALEAADRAVVFKTFLKVLAQRHGLMATFMSRWSAGWPGQGGHVHISLHDQDGTSAFHDPQADGLISDTMRYFIGGQQALLPDLCALLAPTVNSYKRLVPGYWAPTHATWGVDNRTCALRAVVGSPASQRVEHRVPGADANPYLAVAAALGSGLWGIEHRIEPTAPSTGNAYEGVDDDNVLPSSLGEAARRFAASSPARELFGDEFVDHFARTREWEERQFRQHVTDWELERYLEVI